VVTITPIVTAAPQVALALSEPMSLFPDPLEV
jgi:hypothetical protein